MLQANAKEGPAAGRAGLSASQGALAIHKLAQLQLEDAGAGCPLHKEETYTKEPSQTLPRFGPTAGWCHPVPSRSKNLGRTPSADGWAITCRIIAKASVKPTRLSKDELLAGAAEVDVCIDLEEPIPNIPQHDREDKIQVVRNHPLEGD